MRVRTTTLQGRGRELQQYYGQALTYKEWRLLVEGLTHGFLQIDTGGTVILHEKASMEIVIRYGSLHSRQLNAVDLWNIKNSS